MVLIDTIRVYQKLIESEDTLIKPSEILSLEEINKDPYLKTGFYFKEDRIRLVTPQFLISTSRTIGSITVNDMSEYAVGLIQEQGRALILMDSPHNLVIKPLSEKRFLSTGDLRSIPFGLYNFSNPRQNALNITESYSSNLPILVVEGLRDCLNLQTIYPYTIATQTAGLSSTSIEVLRTLTHNLILGFDNDESGQKATRRAQKLGFNSSVLSYGQYKDAGTLSELYLQDSFNYEFFRSMLVEQLKVLSKNIKY